MIARNAIAAIALLAAATVPASAGEFAPANAHSVNLGTLAGVAYYTAEAKGYRVVVTLAPRAAAPAIRFETVLAADQTVTLSTPRACGDTADAVAISRVGDRVVVSAPAAGIVREAAAGE